MWSELSSRCSGAAANLCLSTALALALGCGTADRPEPLPFDGASPLRDVLGVSEEWLELDAVARAQLRQKSFDLVGESPSVERLAELPSGTEGAAGMSASLEDPRGAVYALDAGREARGLDVLPFAVYGVLFDQTIAVGCGPEPADLAQTDGAPRVIPTVPRPPWPAGWYPDESWDGDPAGLDHLAAVAPALAAWSDRCSHAATATTGDSFLPPAHATARITREPQAPFLLAWWPQHATLFVHPLVLELFVDDAATVASARPRFATITAALDVDTTSLGGCVSQMTAYCESCDTQPEAEANAACEPLFGTSPVFQDCTLLGSAQFDGLGLELFCAWKILERRPSTAACVANARSCPVGAVSVVSVETLDEAYGTFIAANSGEACRTILQQCINDPNATLTPPDSTPPPAPGDKEPESCGDRCTNWLGCD